MGYDTVIYEPGTVARVILDRPEKRNAQSWKLLDEMEQAFNEAVADQACRVIVLSGAGPSFSGGHDLDSPEQLADGRERNEGLDGFAHGELLKDIYIDSHLRWRNLPKPTVAMVHGYCVYGGWMIAAAMDVIFAASDALLIPTYGDYFTTHWDVGARKAKEILFENTFMTAEEAMRWGFVGRVYPSDELEAQTLKYAGRVAEHNPLTLRQIKYSINQSLDTMGFSTTVRSLYPDFYRRAARQRAPEPDPRRTQGQFRSQVGRAMDYLREDGLSRPGQG